MRPRLRGRFAPPPRRLRGATLDNLALVPGSALPYKAQWRRLANDLPTDAILVVLPSTETPQRHVLERVSRLLQAQGHQVVAVCQDDLVHHRDAALQLALIGYTAPPRGRT